MEQKKFLPLFAIISTISLAIAFFYHEFSITCSEESLQWWNIYEYLTIFREFPPKTLTSPQNPPKILPCTSQWPILCKFVDPLPLPPRVNISEGKTVHIGAYKILQKLHRDLPATWMYGFGLSQEQASAPGPTLEGQRGQEASILWANHIADRHFPIPVDTSLHWANPRQGGVPMVPHMHGAETSSLWDGHPEAWWTAGGERGPKYTVPPYRYPNQQPPSTMWYHDHTVGTTRLGTYLGLSGAFILRDPWGRERGSTLPAGPHRDLVLVVQDRLVQKDGTLSFPEVGINPPVHPHWVPKLFGNVLSVNGRAWPYLRTAREALRLRLINACNSRYLNISFLATQGAPPGPSIQLPPGATLAFHQISSDGGYLSAPVALTWIQLAPGERADVVLDLRQVAPSHWFVFALQRAHVPNPRVDPPSDDNSLLMRFDLQGEAGGDLGGKWGQPPSPPEIPPLAVAAAQEADLAVQRDLGAVQRERWLTVREYSRGGLPAHSLLGGRRWGDPPSECPLRGATELWHIINLTSGPHGMHLHLAAHRLVARRRFSLGEALSGQCTFPFQRANSSLPLPPCLKGEIEGPEGGEKGWKDTTDCRAGELTSLLVRIRPQEGGHFPFDPSEGPGYVWHCHSVDHEDNEMMRPLVVISQRGSSRA